MPRRARQSCDCSGPVPQVAGGAFLAFDGYDGDAIDEEAQEELPHQKYEKWVAEESRHDDRQEGVDPVQLRKDVEEGNDQDRKGTKDGRQHYPEDEITSRPLDTGEAIGDQRVRDRGADGDPGRQDHRVEEERTEWDVGHGPHEVVEGRRVRV